MKTLKVIKSDTQTILKDGRKIYATVSYNKNPDFKWMLWMKGSFALSGFESEEKAIERANRMRFEWEEAIENLKS